MKTKEFIEELNSKTVAELNNDLVEAKKELFNLRFQNATNQLSNHFKNYISFVRILLEFRQF